MPFGSHGLEILRLHLVPQPTTLLPDAAGAAADAADEVMHCWDAPPSDPMQCDDDDAEGYADAAALHAAGGPAHGVMPPRLEGLKVVGDANVPATKTRSSSTSATRRPRRRLDVDQRLSSRSPRAGRASPTCAAARRDPLRRRGLGQINRVQGKWEPEWVGVDFVLYHDQALGDAGFSVLWDDDGEVIRHIIDFVRLPVKLAAAGDAAHAEPEAARVVGYAGGGGRQGLRAAARHTFRHVPFRPGGGYTCPPSRRRPS